MPDLTVWQAFALAMVFGALLGWWRGGRDF